MYELANSIYQSGQKVEIAGYYEMVGDILHTGSSINRRVLQLLEVEECFPNHDGRAVCWYLVSQVKASTNPKAQVQHASDLYIEHQAGLTG